MGYRLGLDFGVHVGTGFKHRCIRDQVTKIHDPFQLNCTALSHLRFGKSDTLSASIDNIFFIALVGLNLCEAVHNPILQAGRLNLQSTKSPQRQHTNPAPELY